MEERQLGASGVPVSRLILGCGNFGGIGSAPELFGRGETEEEAFAIMDAAWESGINCFDTADAYGGGRSELMVGNWLREKEAEVRARLVLSTKVYNPMEVGGDVGLAPARIRRQLESSLLRLGVDRVGLYLIHEWDPNTPIEETLAELDGLVRAGTVGAVGASNVSGRQLETALATSAREDSVRFEWVQNEYSLLARDVEQEVLPLCAAAGLGFTPFSPLAGGWLAGKYRRGVPPPPGSRMTLRPEPYEHLRSDRSFAALGRFADAAASRGVEPATLALAWLLADQRITSVIVGPRRPDHLRPAIEALSLPLTAAERAELTELVR